MAPLPSNKKLTRQFSHSNKPFRNSASSKEMGIFGSNRMFRQKNIQKRLTIAQKNSRDLKRKSTPKSRQHQLLNRFTSLNVLKITFSRWAIFSWINQFCSKLRMFEFCHTREFWGTKETFWLNQFRGCSFLI